MKQYLFNLVLSMAILGGFVSACASDYSWQEDAGSLTLFKQEQIVWRFNYGKDQTKPYFDPVSLPGHSSLTWVGPPDHPWHYGVWFSWKYINGVNYWEENRKTLKPAGVTSWDAVEISRKLDGAATTSMQVRYAPVAKTNLLTETRVIRISAPDASGQYHMDWEQTFKALADLTLDRTPPPGNPGSKPWGGYGGLSVRFSRNFKQWKAATSESHVDMKAHGQHASAADFSGSIKGVLCGIAILDHLDNPTAPTAWFYVMQPQVPFAYFNPAVLFHKPLTMKAGEEMVLRYRVVVHPGRWNVEMLKSEIKTFGGVK